MTSYAGVDAEIKRGTPLDVLCATCPWDRLCVRPPTYSSEQIREHLEKAADVADKMDAAGNTAGAAARVLTVGAIIAGRDRSGEQCPVLTARLRADRAVSDGIKAVMQSYGQTAERPAPATMGGPPTAG